jgi:hypothetical protein
MNYFLTTIKFKSKELKDVEESTFRLEDVLPQMP